MSGMFLYHLFFQRPAKTLRMKTLENLFPLIIWMLCKLRILPIQKSRNDWMGSNELSWNVNPYNKIKEWSAGLPMKKSYLAYEFGFAKLGLVCSCGSCFFCCSFYLFHFEILGWRWLATWDGMEWCMSKFERESSGVTSKRKKY